MDVLVVLEDTALHQIALVQDLVFACQARIHKNFSVKGLALKEETIYYKTSNFGIQI